MNNSAVLKGHFLKLKRKRYPNGLSRVEATHVQQTALIRGQRITVRQPTSSQTNPPCKK